MDKSTIDLRLLGIKITLHALRGEKYNAVNLMIHVLIFASASILLLKFELYDLFEVIIVIKLENPYQITRFYYGNR